MHCKPFGVIAAIASWNWPLLIAMFQIAAPLRAGNTVVIKPSEYASIGTLEMIRLTIEVLSPGVLNTVTGTGEVGGWLVENPDIDKIMFTGSEATGAKVAAVAARNLTPHNHGTGRQRRGGSCWTMPTQMPSRWTFSGATSSTWARAAPPRSGCMGRMRCTMRSWPGSRPRRQKAVTQPQIISLKKKPQ